MGGLTNLVSPPFYNHGILVIVCAVSFLRPFSAFASDTTPPQVSWVAPAANSAVSGIVTLTGVGTLSIAPTVLALSTNTGMGREVVVSHLLSVSNTTPSGNYSDQITYSCLGN